VNVGTLLIADAQPAELVQPGKGPFHNPSPSSKAAAVFNVAYCEQRHDASITQTLPDCFRVITTVLNHAIRSVARTPAHALQWWNGINECKGKLRVVKIRPSQLNCQRNAVTVADQMTLAAGLCPIGRIGTGLLPPKTALIELPSTTARDQSILSERASQSRIAKWINCQIPTSCQSRKRRQHVMAEPHPSSCGSISQGMPVRNTNMMPARHARSGKRGLPPLAFAFGLGMKDSTILQNSSGKAATGIGKPPTPSIYRARKGLETKERFC
jgi:hypothetical protein